MNLNIKIIFKWITFLSVILFFTLAIFSIFPLFQQILSPHEFLIKRFTSEKYPNYSYIKDKPYQVFLSQSLKNPYIHIKFLFKSKDQSGYQNLFQTSKYNRGLRIELVGSNASILIPINSGSDTYKLVDISRNVQIEKWHSVEVEALNGSFVKVNLDGKSISYTSRKISFDSSQIFIGVGFDESRPFKGEIRNVHLEKGDYSKKRAKTILYSLLLISLGGIFYFSKEEKHKRLETLNLFFRNYWLILLSVIVIALFVFTMITASNFPIYSDEIEVRYWLSRIPYDFPWRSNGMPRCLSTYSQNMPLTMIWPALLNWAVNGTFESPSSLRYTGVALIILLISCLTYYLYSKHKTSPELSKFLPSNLFKILFFLGFIISIYSVGVFPIFLVIARSEQLIIPSVAVLLLLQSIIKFRKEKDNKSRDTLVLIAYLTCASLILFGHAKGLFLLPFVLISGFVIFTKLHSNKLLAFSILLVTIMAIQAYSMWINAFECIELPAFAAWLKSFSFDPLMIFYDPINFLNNFLVSLERFYIYLDKLSFMQISDWNLLPTIKLDNPTIAVSFFIKINTALILIWLLIKLITECFHSVSYKNAKFYLQKNFLLLILFFCISVSGIFNIPKNWYDAGYLYSLYLLTLIFYLSDRPSNFFTNRFVLGVYAYLLLISLFSQFIFTKTYLALFLEGYQGSGVPVRLYEKQNIHDDLVRASRLCNIDPEYSSRVVVDDITYGFFRKSQLPMSITYIWLDQNDRMIKNFFSKADSGGIVVHCSSVPNSYFHFFHKEGNVCCLSKKEVNAILDVNQSFDEDK